MTRSLFFAVAMFFVVPALAGCGGDTETRLIEGNDLAAIEAEEAEAENQEPPTEEPGAFVNSNEP